MQSGIEAIAALAAAQTGLPAPVATTGDASQVAAAPSAFANLMQNEIAELNTNLGAAETAMSDLAAGKSVELHDVMISLERARMSVQTFVQVRNKLVESYQDLMRMQL